jgi:hypothetical protein
VPPLTAVALNGTVVPAQILFIEDEMDTLTGNNGFTVIVTELEVAGFPVVQVALEVTTHVTALPLAGMNE